MDDQRYDLYSKCDDKWFMDYEYVGYTSDEVTRTDSLKGVCNNTISIEFSYMFQKPMKCSSNASSIVLTINEKHLMMKEVLIRPVGTDEWMDPTDIPFILQEVES